MAEKVRVFENVTNGLTVEVNPGLLADVQVECILKQVDEDGVRLFKEVKTSKAKLEKAE